jgi:hypothetical protein
VLQVIAAWPGWMAGDSADMLEQARTGMITDWHSPLLIYAWRFLGDQTLGPLLPFLIQNVVVWTGFTLIAMRLARAGWTWAWVCLPSLFLVSTMWLWSWVLKDSLLTAMMMLALGLATLGDVAHGRVAVRLVKYGPAVLLAIAVVPRWYLVPAMLIAVVGTTRLAGWTSGWRPAAAAAGVFMVLVGLLYVFEARVVRPTPSFAMSSTLFLDMARVECQFGTPEARADGISAFPEQLIEDLPGQDICEDFTPYSHDPLFFDKEGTRYVMPANDAQMQEVVTAWLTVWREHPGLLVQSRFEQAGRFLNGSSHVWLSPSATLYTDSVVGQPGGIGTGAEAGFESRGGTLLVGLATITSVGANLFLTLPFGFITMILLPLIAWARVRGRGQFERSSFRWALWFPLAYLAIMAFLTPSDDFRYAIPASWWGLAVFALAMVPWAQPARLREPPTQVYADRHPLEPEDAPAG